MRIFIITLLLSAAALPAASQDDWQSRKNRENAATSAGSITNNGGSWDARGEAERARQNQIYRQQQPLSFTTCDRGFCYDNMGNAWSRNGPNFLSGPNGRSCFLSGNSWSCN